MYPCNYDISKSQNFFVPDDCDPGDVKAFNFTERLIFSDVGHDGLLCVNFLHEEKYMDRNVEM